MTRMPVVFVPHGGGPWPFVEIGFPKDDVKQLADYLRSVSSIPPVPPKTLLVGSPVLASLVRALLDAAGVVSEADGERGYDHGTFIPLKLTYPNADVPATTAPSLASTARSAGCGSRRITSA